MSRKIEPKIYENHWLFKLPVIKEYDGITLWPYVLLKDEIDEQLLFHENVHVQQIEKIGLFRFYFGYVFHFVINLFKYQNFTDAYYKIPFEIEAYELTKRKFNKDVYGQV